jgi:hypothetical protein
LLDGVLHRVIEFKIRISTQIPFSLSLSAITRPSFSTSAEVLNFIKEAKKFIPHVRITVVIVEGVDIDKCRQIVENLEVGFRVRKLDVVG